MTRTAHYSTIALGAHHTGIGGTAEMRVHLTRSVASGSLLGVARICLVVSALVTRGFACLILSDIQYWSPSSQSYTTDRVVLGA